MTRDDTHLPALRRKMPALARAGIDAIADEFGLTWEEVAFIALRKVGVSQKRAYLHIRPDVSEASATSLGYRWNKRLAPQMNQISLNCAQAVLADWVATEAMIDRGAQYRDRLSAAEQVNRRLGRYQQEEPAAPSAVETLFELARILEQQSRPGPEVGRDDNVIDVEPLQLSGGDE